MLTSLKELKKRIQGKNANELRQIIVKRLYGGLSNFSYLITDSNKKYVARFLTNREHYHVLNFHELAANKAASEAGVAPKVVYNNKVFLIFEYIPSNTLKFENLKQEKYLKKIIFLLKIVHKNVANYFHGPALTFWPFHSIKDYVTAYSDITAGTTTTTGSTVAAVTTNRTGW